MAILAEIKCSMIHYLVQCASVGGIIEATSIKKKVLPRDYYRGVLHLFVAVNITWLKQNVDIYLENSLIAVGNSHGRMYV